jgi:2-iminobutanoate/2-iminopropanoate deaminase
VKLSDAVRMAVYVTDISTFAQVNEVYGTYFETDPPARTTIGVAALPGGARIEMDAIVALPD